MNKGPILIVEDDEDDREMLIDALKQAGLTNEFICFTTAAPALAYLQRLNDMPFLIISDINMPGINGLEFRKRITAENNPALTRIPFIFLSTSDDEKIIATAQELLPQGYFVKPESYPELHDIARSIVEYWTKAKLQGG